MSNNELWRLGASELTALTRSGEISAGDAVQAALARMDAVNPGLNAVVEDLRHEALERAAALDRLAPGMRGPLHGVPVTIKINVDQAGHATSNGVPALKDLIAPADAPVVDNLQKAGAVVIGRTNTPEFSFRADTDNPLHGRTRNPWGRHVSPGGSSGRRRRRGDGRHRHAGAWQRHRRLAALPGGRQWRGDGKARAGPGPRLEPRPAG